MDDQLEVSANTLPNYYDLLSNDDKKVYDDLRKELSSSERKFKRNQRVRSFQDALQLIYQYCIRNDENDWKRCLVCGICWIGLDIAINTRQLRILINKCKSSINGALAKMGYGNTPIKLDNTEQLTSALPILKGNFLEQRLWSVRKRSIVSPAPYPMMMYMSPYPSAQLFVSPQPMHPSPQYSQSNEVSSIFTNAHLKDQTPVNSSPSASQSPQNVSSPPSYPVSQEPNSPINVTQTDILDGDINYLDLLTDPCCCCPRQWFTMEENNEDLFSYS